MEAEQNKGIGQLSAAYVKARKKITHTTKNRQNPHFGSDYATLDAVIDSYAQPFGEEGLALLQAPGEIDGDKISVIGLLMHESGQSVSFKTQVPLGSKVTAQAAGSAITYARRYQAAAVAGIAQIDDDGNAASESPRSKANAKGPSYAEGVEALLAEIDTMTSAGMDDVKKKVQALGDTKVADAFIAKKKALKEAK